MHPSLWPCAIDVSVEFCGAKTLVQLSGLLNAFKRVSVGASAADRIDLFSVAAARGYRIENVPLT
ncbi:MAG: hypothetical protein ACJAVI_004602 [Candidatus Azotimanducaceae bacterium]|jgi:hypothetical protein